MATVLLVDDDPMVLEFCHHVLAGICGLHVMKASSAAEAIDLAARPGPIEVLVSDISMPGGMNGIELAETLSVSHPQIRVLLMSGLHPGNFVLNASWQFLPKPFRPHDLTSRVEAMLVDGAGKAAVRPMPIVRPIRLMRRAPAGRQVNEK